MSQPNVGRILQDLERSLDLAMERLSERRQRLRDYDSIQRSVRNVNIIDSSSFRQEFARFYKLRGSSTFRDIFFRVFEEVKHTSCVSFDQVLSSIHKRCGQVHPSFASKIVASLDGDQPVYDSEVLKRLGLTATYERDLSLRLHKASVRYQSIKHFFEAALGRCEAKRMLKRFDGELSDYAQFTPTKKLDLIMWQARSRVSTQTDVKEPGPGWR